MSSQIQRGSSPFSLGSLANSVFSIYVWITWVLLLFTLGPLVALVTVVSRPAGFVGLQLGTRLAFALAGIRVRVVGDDRVDWTRTHVFMGNHQNLLDPFVFAQAIRHHLVGIEKQENLKVPVYGWLTRVWGNLQVDRGNPQASRATIAAAVERLKAGTSIAILPEGTRTKDGLVGTFKKGGFHLAIDAGADIVPFTINGCLARLQNGDWRIQPGTVELVYGETVSTEGLGKEDLDALVARVRDAIIANYRG